MNLNKNKAQSGLRLISYIWYKICRVLDQILPGTAQYQGEQLILSISRNKEYSASIKSQKLMDAE